MKHKKQHKEYERESFEARLQMERAAQELVKERLRAIDLSIETEMRRRKSRGQ